MIGIKTNRSKWDYSYYIRRKGRANRQLLRDIGRSNPIYLGSWGNVESNSRQSHR
jgi:hypothetical protein